MDREIINPLWHLHEELTIDQAASLVAGYDPELLDVCKNDTSFHGTFKGFMAARTAIANAFRLKKITGTVIPVYECDINGNIYGEVSDSIDPSESRVDVDSLKSWLIGRGFRTGFFFPKNEDTAIPGYLNPDHPRFAPKLAAAVHAWEAMEDENLLQGKSVKRAIEDWLTSRYKEFLLYHATKNETNGTNPGDINNSAISQAALVANWNPDGGAPKTPGK
jgi:hypothetical protein